MAGPRRATRAFSIVIGVALVLEFGGVGVGARPGTTASARCTGRYAYALDGIRYILDEADRIAAGRPLRVVINFSFGNVAGPHDGTADLERAIAEIIEKCRHKAPLDVVLPSGNSHLARLHAKIPFPHDKQAGGVPFDPHRVDLQWRVLPDDRTPSFVEIWLPRAWDADKAPHPPTKSRVSLVITPPGLPPGPGSSPDLRENQGQGVQLRSAQGDVLCEARYRYVGEPTDRGMFLIALQPTRSEARVPQGDRPVAPSGIWTITLQATSLAGAQPVQAWVQRDDTPYGFPRRGRQSYFDQPCYERFDAQGRVIVEDEKARPCVVTRSGSLNSIATGSGVTVVAGRVGSTGRLARYAGRESIGPLGRRTHVATEVSDESPVLVGVLGAGTRSGSRVRLNGTSVAAPQRSKKESEREGASVPYLAGSQTSTC